MAKITYPESPFAKRLRAARKAVGLTQTQLGQKAGGIAYSAISSYESGRVCPRGEVVKRLADALGVSVAYLIEGVSATATDTNAAITCKPIVVEEPASGDIGQAALVGLLAAIEPNAKVPTIQRMASGILKNVEAFRKAIGITDSERKDECS